MTQQEATAFVEQCLRDHLGTAADAIIIRDRLLFLRCVNEVMAAERRGELKVPSNVVHF